MRTNRDTAVPSAAVYSKPVLSVYDLFVLGFSNRFAWKCPSQRILDFYNEHVSAEHLDVGVGTGYFLDKCRFPSPTPAITLADLNPNSLQRTAKRLRRYNPVTCVANVLEPLPIEPASFDSVGLNYLLHCLPGDMRSKAIVFRNLRPLLRPGGVVFGTTILGQGVPQNALARTLMRLYNARGIFGNAGDIRSDLETILQESFRDGSVRVVGCVAFFVGRR